MGVGWSAEEFDALGVPFARRGPRTSEYIAAMRRVWTDDVARFAGEFVRFDGVRVYPKPVRERAIPVIVGGTTDAALRRVAAIGDGWYGFNLPAADVADRVGALAAYCTDVVATPPAAPDDAAAWVDELAARWIGDADQQGRT